MKFWQTLTSNYYINIAVSSWLIAQILKGILNLLVTKKVTPERFLGSGGMPSSHSAFTVSMAVAIARNLGFDSTEFALSFVFAIVVMTDAMGIRRAAGEQAKLLNKLVFEFSDFPWFIRKDKSVSVEVPLEQLEKSEKHEIDEEEELATGALLAKELKEYLGHTPLEVLGGCLLGIIIALIVPKAR